MSEIAALEARLRTSESWEDWLVYADWLSDQGDVRGRLIALHHRASRPELDAASRTLLQREIDAITEAHRSEWLTGLALPRAVDVAWRYGFVAGLTFRSRSHSDPLGVVLRALESKNARFLTAVSAPYTRLDDDDVASFAASDRIGALTALDLSCNPLGEDSARALAGAKLSSLRSLNLGGTALGDAGARRIAQAENLRSLTEVALADAKLDLEGSTAIVASPVLDKLVTLDLSTNYIGDEGARAIARSPQLGSLVCLRLSYGQIGDEGALTLAASGALGALEELSLRDNAIGLSAALALARSESLRSLRTLDLSNNRLGWAGRREAFAAAIPARRNVRW